MIDSDLAHIRGEIHLDDDKPPAVPSQDLSAGQRRRDESNVIFEGWGHDGVCQQ